MYKKCSVESSINRQKKIANEFLEFMQKQNINHITVADITQHLDIPRKTFYRYFECKEGVIAFLIDEALEEFRVVQEEYALVDISTQFKIFFDFWYSKKMLLNALKSSDLDRLLMAHSTYRLTNKYMGESNLNYHPSSEFYTLAMTFTVSGLYALLLNWRDTGFKRTSKALAVMTQELLMQSLFKEK